MQGRVSGTIIGVAAIVVLCVLAWKLAYDDTVRRLSEGLSEELALVERSVDTEIERFHSVPAVVKEDPRIHSLIDQPNPANAEAADSYLQIARDGTGAAEIFVMDARGLTLAASNWQSARSFVGHNYGFRPYFIDAIVSGEGRFYAVGVTTGVPGYFLASRIVTTKGKVGVVVVKVDFSPLEGAWQGANTYTAIADAAGVVFLAGQPSWKYRPVAPLTQTDVALIEKQRKYADIDVGSAEPLFASQPDAGGDIRSGRLLVRTRQLEREGWELIDARSLAAAGNAANVAAILTALSGALAAALLLFVRQRRQLAEFRLRQNAMLEERVAIRTRELAREIEDRKRTEADLRETQEELVQSAKLAALGQMSAAIAHEVSQPLTALEMTLSAAATHLDNGNSEMVTEKLGLAQRLTRRMQGTIRHLRVFARKDGGGSAAVDGAEAARGALELAEPRARAVGVDIVAVYPHQGLLVMANAVRLEQVLLNLLLNALDAVEGREAREVSLEASRRDTTVCFRISDSGVGIPHDMEDKIVKPFFTTKSGGEGMGLGLSISSTIVEEFGGSMRFSHNPGGGTICEVCLPALDGPADRQAAQ